MWMDTVRKSVPQQKMQDTGQATEEELMTESKEEKWAGEFIYCLALNSARRSGMGRYE